MDQKQKQASRELAAAIASLSSAGIAKFVRHTSQMTECYSVMDRMSYFGSDLSVIAIGALADWIKDYAVSVGKADFGDNAAALRQAIEKCVAEESEALLSNRRSRGGSAMQAVVNEAQREAASWIIRNAPRWLEKLSKEGL